MEEEREKKTIHCWPLFKLYDIVLQRENETIVILCSNLSSSMSYSGVTNEGARYYEEQRTGITEDYCSVFISTI